MSQITPHQAMDQAVITTEYYIDAAYDYYKRKGITPSEGLIKVFVESCSTDFATFIS